MQNPPLFKGMIVVSGALALPEDGQDYAEEPAPLRWAMRESYITETLRRIGRDQSADPASPARKLPL